MAYVAPSGNTIQAYTTGLPPVVSLTAQSTVQNGTALDGLAIRQNATATVTSGAGVTGGVVALQGSLDGTNYVALGSSVTTSAANTTYQITVSNALVRYVRLAITTAIAGGSVSGSVGVNG